MPSAEETKLSIIEETKKAIDKHFTSDYPIGLEEQMNCATLVAVDVDEFLAHLGLRHEVELDVTYTVLEIYYYPPGAEDVVFIKVELNEFEESDGASVE